MASNVRASYPKGFTGVEIMDKKPEEPSLEGLLLAINQLARIHERIAQSLNVIENLRVEEFKKRDEERDAARAWMEDQEARAGKYANESKERRSFPIPWQITGVWVGAILVLTMGLILILIEISKHVFGAASS